MGMNFFAELKRRNVLRAAALYVGASWALAQGISQLSPAIGLPDWATRWFLIAAAIGFPFAMVLSWFYEWTPRGIVREGEVEVPETVRYSTGRKLDFAIIGVLAIAVVLLLTDRFVAHKDAGLDKSIAVLPFANLSSDKDNAYFAIGIQDEILTRLAKIRALKVISRTSTQRYASSPDNLPEIARQLGVANILEGSVQKSGDRVHINVQLIQAATDQHLWADSYDRKLDDVFGVEGEVAQTIAQTLQARLSGAEVAQLAALPTTNPAAYDAYLRGLAAERSVFGSVPTLKAAAAFHAQATALDPKFALAWARGSIDDGLIWFQGFDRSPARLEAARHGADMAMQLAPESPEGWLAKGMLLYHTQDYDGARTAYAEADRRWPDNPEILAARGFLERRSGHFDQAIALFTRALDRDPQNIGNITTVSDTCNSLGRPRQALAWVDRALTFNPTDAAIINRKAEYLIAAGELDAAGRLLDPLPIDVDDVYATQNRAIYLFARRDYPAAIRMLQRAVHAPGFVLNAWNGYYYVYLGWAQKLSGDTGAARATFSEARARIQALEASTGDNGYLASQLAFLDAGLGDADGAEREGRLGVQRAGKDRLNALGLTVSLAAAQALSGRKQQALTTLEGLVNAPVPILYGDLKLSPFWDGLRGDPRFAALLTASQARLEAQARSEPGLEGAP